MKEGKAPDYTLELEEVHRREENAHIRTREMVKALLTADIENSRVKNALNKARQTLETWGEDNVRFMLVDQAGSRIDDPDSDDFFAGRIKVDIRPNGPSGVWQGTPQEIPTSMFEGKDVENLREVLFPNSSK